MREKGMTELDLAAPRLLKRSEIIKQVNRIRAYRERSEQQTLGSTDNGFNTNASKH